MSYVTCHLSHIKKKWKNFITKKKKIKKQIGQYGGASRWRVCYQLSLPRLVFFLCLASLEQPGRSLGAAWEQPGRSPRLCQCGRGIMSSLWGTRCRMDICICSSREECCRSMVNILPALNITGHSASAWWRREHWTSSLLSIVQISGHCIMYYISLYPRLRVSLEKQGRLKL